MRVHSSLYSCLISPCFRITSISFRRIQRLGSFDSIRGLRIQFDKEERSLGGNSVEKI